MDNNYQNYDENNYDDNEIHGNGFYNHQLEQNEEVDENDVDDVYLLELQRHLVQMRKERKNAQLEAELLQNRIRLLKNEEGKVSYHCHHCHYCYHYPLFN